MSYRALKWIGLIGVALGLAVLALSATAPRGYPEALWWAGVLTGVLATMMGGAVAWVGATELPLIDRGDQPTREELGRPVESFRFPLVGSSEERSLARYRGQPVLLHLWASWCPPCEEEIPALNRLQEEHDDDGLVVITLSPEEPDQLEAFAERQPFSTVNGYIPDSDALPDPFRRGFRTLPTSYLIDRDGHLQAFVLGSRSYREWEEKVLDVL